MGPLDTGLRPETQTGAGTETESGSGGLKVPQVEVSRGGEVQRVMPILSLLLLPLLL